jgi:hypothetical protein
MNTKRHYIYGLGHPRTGKLFYVGRTTNPVARYRNHCGLSGRLGKGGQEGEFFGVKPVFVVLKGASDVATAATYEMQTIREMRALGHPLVNVLPINPNPPRYKTTIAPKFTLNELIRS